MIFWEEYNKIDLWARTIVKSEPIESAHRASLKLWIDFGPNWGSKNIAHKSITTTLKPEGSQVICVTSFPPKQIANFISEVTATGFHDEKGDVVL